MRLNSLFTKIFLLWMGLSLGFMLLFAYVAYVDTLSILRVYYTEEQVPNIFFPDVMINDDIYNPELTKEQNLELVSDALIRWYTLDLIPPLIVFILMCLLFAHSITKPIRSLVQGTQKVAQGDFKAYQKKTTNDEIGDLVDSFNQMITEIRSYRKKLTHKIKQLDTALINARQSDKVKTQFLNVTSHELRTPITPIRAQLQMVLTNLMGDVSGEQKNALQLVLTNIDKLDQLIGDILDISKLESGVMTFEIIENDFNVMLRTVFETMKIEAEQKQITIVSKFDSISSFPFDKVRIDQLISNFIKNAIKFTNPEGTITVRAIDGKDKVHVSVQDTGIGIAKKDLVRIFKPFQQVDSTRIRNRDGTGLGLAICRAIVLKHGGEIWAESKQGDGSTFHFTLPYNYSSQRDEINIFNFQKLEKTQKKKEN